VLVFGMSASYICPVVSCPVVSCPVVYMSGHRQMLAAAVSLAAVVTEAGVKARRLADTETPAHGLEGPPSGRPRPPRQSFDAVLLALPLAIWYTGIGAPSASSIYFVPADGPAPPVLALYVLIATGIVCLAVALWRALRHAKAAAREATAKADGLERELLKQQHVEEVSPQREERYRTPLDQSQDYTIFLLDAKGKPTSWHSGVRGVLGYEKFDFLRMSAADLYTAEDREAGAPERDFTEATEHGRSDSERWIVRKDGSRFWASISISTVTDRQGRLLGFSQRLRDLSQSKHAEEQLRQKQEALELALEAGGLGTWEYDLATGEMHWDARAKAHFGLRADAIVTHPAWLEALHPEDQESTRNRWEHAVRDRAPLSVECRVIWPDGSTHWIMAVGQCTFDAATSEPVHMAGVMLDLTERRRSEEHLQESMRLEAVGRLAGGIAHDLNNMLTAILGFSEFLNRSLAPDDSRRADVEQISRAADRSASLTRQLLAFARRDLIQPRVLDLNSVVRHTGTLLPSILGENVELVLQLTTDRGIVYADPRQIEQTLMNLVLNARDALPQGGRVTIETMKVRFEPGSRASQEMGDAAPTGSFTMLAVTDTGHGMGAATLQRIWEPFFTTKPPGHGTGLGLSSVYGAAKQSGGFVWAASEPGRGTTVQVYWPEVPEEEPEPLVESSGLPEVEGGSETVLVVEDEDLVRAFVVRALRSHGYQCREARDAEGALRLLEHGHAGIDLVITDVVMPGMSGGGLGDRLALLRPGLPVLYTSAFVDEDVIRRGLLEQGRPFLQKPCTPRDLARKVREVLDAAGSTRDQAETV
jgi:two-component system cell cycle sensor histidine kinase/response regulator CckA